MNYLVHDTTATVVVVVVVVAVVAAAAAGAVAVAIAVMTSAVVAVAVVIVCPVSLVLTCLGQDFWDWLMKTSSEWGLRLYEQVGVLAMSAFSPVCMNRSVCWQCPLLAPSVSTGRCVGNVHF